MNRKIIIKMEDLNKGIYFFLKEVGADIPLEWSAEAIDSVRHAIIEAFGKMGVTLQIDDRLPSVPSSNLSKKEGNWDASLKSSH